MALGPAVRRLLGPIEPAAARLYRDAFFDVSAFAAAVREWTDASSILEVGCGDGLATAELRGAFPRAAITGIDIQPVVGRLFRGDRAGVTFLSGDLDSFVAGRRERFDLVVICDVLHHVPAAQRAGLLRCAAQALRAGGSLAVKEWERRPNLAHLGAWFSDRFITGAQVRFETADALRALVESALGAPVEREVRLPPWRNNLGLFLRPGAR